MKRFILSFLLLAAFFPVSGKAQQNCSLAVQGNVINASCLGGMDGAIRLQVSGGTKPYTIYWSNGKDVQDIGELTEGNYTVTVQDSEGCVGRKVFSVESIKSDDLKVHVEQQQAGGGMKTLSVTFGQGKKPFAIKIKKVSDGITAPFYAYNGQGLSGGIYTLEAFTEAGCSVITRVMIDAK